ncbi:hypothetical protein KP509_23G003100 [Ceratopteris richardii]|uniref:Transcription factor IIIC 90kDa subunit N-terminal domain-containing protein n=2 Tax=Ceratopteris richardii TaxID=49495 RepID=A0A8T2RZ58_CERRI|nr:hypothetical protein KP509_23G003100 [Ceratopteris richardii]KAH7300915.1 hypothetical protein KP509_23G003100 [Ceratopteris richardii]
MAGKRPKLEVVRRRRVSRPQEHPAPDFNEDDESALLCENLPEYGAEEDEDVPGKVETNEQEEVDLNSEQRQESSFTVLSTTLVSSPIYPNSVKWSDDNLIGIATSQLITILNPALIDGPRGFVTASSGPPLVVGTVQQEDVDDSCLLPIRLSKDLRPVVRSMDWSPQGLAPNGGCLLAVCTRDHRVKLYRAPHSEYQCEWIQVYDVSELLNGYHLKSGPRWKETQEGDSSPGDTGTGNELALVRVENQSNCEGPTSKDLAMVPFGSSVSADTRLKSAMDPKDFLALTNVLSYVSVGWSPAFRLESFSNQSLKKTNLIVALLALGAKSGEISILKCTQPVNYSLEKATSSPDVSLVTIIKAHESWVSTLTWCKSGKTLKSETDSDTSKCEEILLATGSTDGSVKLWVGDVGNFTDVVANSDPFILLRKIVPEDHSPVTSIALINGFRLSGCIQVAIGKGSGSITVIEVSREEDAEKEVKKWDAHSHAVTGLIWAFNGHCLYSCSQDNNLYVWKCDEENLVTLPFPHDSSDKSKRSVFLADSVLDGYYGLCLSKGSLALATLRGVSAELLDQMYESRAVKAMAQVFWVGNQSFQTSSTPADEIRIGHFEAYIRNWESNLLEALHYLENINVKLALWDVRASLEHLACIKGKKYVNTVILRWISSLGLVYSDANDGKETISSMKTRHEGIVNASSRRLQIVFAILKGLFLTEGHDPLTIMDKLSFRKSYETFETFDYGWRSFALDIEHELRERLVHLSISLVLLVFKDGNASTVDGKYVDYSALMCMLQWITINSSKVSKQVLCDAHSLAQIFRRGVELESCTICAAKVSFMSTEMGICDGTHPHKLPRCSVTFKLCPPGSHWFCYCCARWASKQTPRIFFTCSSRHSLNNLDSSELIQDVEPACPYCGILMQRYFPDSFLRLSLV